MNAQAQPIHRHDIEAKLRELQGGVTDTRESATSTLLTVVLVGVVAVAFFMGRRKGKKRTTVVEVRRI